MTIAQAKWEVLKEYIILKGEDGLNEYDRQMKEVLKGNVHWPFWLLAKYAMLSHSGGGDEFDLWIVDEVGFKAILASVEAYMKLYGYIPIGRLEIWISGCYRRQHLWDPFSEPTMECEMAFREFYVGN